jgi:AbrB family looped-hinge helix DNA binding protein
MKKGKKFYGTVTVTERGQISLPAEARKDFEIEAGDKLLVLGDLEKGIALAKSNFVLQMMGGTLEAMNKMKTLFRENVETEE